mmetsp:Transcript_16243/g.26791  ORF Transcript_16243/g.26791 Transcript_16243/m.26791 type:complete len:957 (-) Transcript_16243:249-3119(-)|eukprot:CAMPEP_0184350700 /NCGR_PEP_ID=MMETSP1089-20130417/40618_1 /TAXON_ID=38269 ORGANISM="Gloeochaete wittrockiana, Strain SAG46.84" /NCGR_SAMPLE_ID=MMETSP1089 /ASSEMBLY_ACC=CAM_ASM_000445 /LENGTH=956 /DNA_ID=CAMNT_0026683655 /DNA_START=187 /DNA_END=3057 /DNA_ORIENTATION=+
MAGSEIPVQFRVPYNTHFGENILLQGPNVPVPEERKNVHGGLAMFYKPGGKWETVLNLPIRTLIEGFSYRYAHVTADGKFQAEGGGYRCLKIPSDVTYDSIEVVDVFKRASDPAHLFGTSIFSDVIFRRPKLDGCTPVLALSKNEDKRKWVRLQVHCPRILPTDVLCISGSATSLGAWDISKACALDCGSSFPNFKLDILIDPQDLPLEYKYLIVNSDRSKATWEIGLNRSITKDHFHDAHPPVNGIQKLAMSNGSITANGESNSSPKEHMPCAVTVFTDDPFRYSGDWRGAGVAIPVFSLRSQKGLGVGEFLDLKLLADWASKAGLKLVQLLPINDTSVTKTWKDSYPYSSVSVIALHPQYMNIPAIGGLSEATLDYVSKEAARLNALPDIDYEAMMKIKTQLLHDIYIEQKDQLFATDEFKQFYAENKGWLVPYALFCFFRDVTDSAEFDKWGRRDTMSMEDMEAFSTPGSFYYDAIALNYFIQFHLNKQLMEAVEYSVSKGVALKGDLPIGVNKYCADTWVARRMFRMNTQTGAPPDAFAKNGQNWGFPTYDWDAMAVDGYAWWRSRLALLNKYFQAFRIDHVLGFFRIWEIPDHCVKGLLGRFRPCLPITRGELDARGIWDINRLCEPYIRSHLVERIFHGNATHIIQTYLQPCDPRPYAFKFRPEYDTERKIQASLALPASAVEAEREVNEKLMDGLFSLLSNVILIRDGTEPNAFHFRIDMKETSSYQELPSESWKQDLQALYVNYFYERQDVLWQEKAMEKLPVMKEASGMLVCGEDLGMVPRCVAGVLTDLAILGLRIQRMPTEERTEFGNPATYPYLTIASPSCHDMSTIRGWWEEDRGATQRFFNHILKRGGGAPQVCTPELVSAIVEQHLSSPSILAVFPLQDLVGMKADICRPNPKDEQINVPANPNHYWRYRFHLDLEDLVTNSTFSTQVRDMIQSSGRLSPY